MFWMRFLMLDDVRQLVFLVSFKKLEGSIDLFISIQLQGYETHAFVWLLFPLRCMSFMIFWFRIVISSTIWTSETFIFARKNFHMNRVVKVEILNRVSYLYIWEVSNCDSQARWLCRRVKKPPWYPLDLQQINVFFAISTINVRTFHSLNFSKTRHHTATLSSPIILNHSTSCDVMNYTTLQQSHVLSWSKDENSSFCEKYADKICYETRSSNLPLSS